MNLRKILKNRKAMTPIMIGIIVAASVLATFFLIMAVTIPYMKNDLYMEIQQVSIRGNSTDQESLIFRVICDYENGTITKYEIYKDNLLYGEQNQTEEFYPRESRFIRIRYFNAVLGNVPGGEIQNGTHLQFQIDETYTLRIYYETLEGIEKPPSEAEFIFDIPN